MLELSSFHREKPLFGVVRLPACLPVALPPVCMCAEVRSAGQVSSGQWHINGLWCNSQPTVHLRVRPFSSSLQPSNPSLGHFGSIINLTSFGHPLPLLKSHPHSGRGIHHSPGKAVPYQPSEVTRGVFPEKISPVDLCAFWRWPVVTSLLCFSASGVLLYFVGMDFSRSGAGSAHSHQSTNGQVRPPR